MCWDCAPNGRDGARSKTPRAESQRLSAHRGGGTAEQLSYHVGCVIRHRNHESQHLAEVRV
jgi:hypothetical protein